jgi:outer membrane protein
MALRQHPSLTRLDEARQAAEARERAAASSFYPHLTLEALEKDGPPSAPGFGFAGLANSTLTRHTGASVILSQLLYDFGRARHQTRARRFAAGAASADEEAQRGLVTLSVYETYNNALLAQRLVQVAQENLAARELTVRQAQARFDAGLTSGVDVDLAQANQAQARVGLVNAQNGLQQAFADLNAAMGTTSPEAYTLEDLPAHPQAGTRPAAAAPATPLEQDIGVALRQRPEIRSVEAQAQATEETARAARASGLPLITGLVSGGYLNVAPPASNTNHDHALGLRVSFPFYTGGEVEAEVSDTRHQAKALRAAREEEAQAIRLQVTRARLTLTSLAQSQQATEEQLRQARDSVSLATQRYQAGLGNFLELQQAQLALLAAETDAARLRYETVTAQAALGYALGTLTPPGLGAEGRGPGKVPYVRP